MSTLCTIVLPSSPIPIEFYRTGLPAVQASLLKFHSGTKLSRARAHVHTKESFIAIGPHVWSRHICCIEFTFVVYLDIPWLCADQGIGSPQNRTHMFIGYAHIGAFKGALPSPG